MTIKDDRKRANPVGNLCSLTTFAENGSKKQLTVQFSSVYYLATFSYTSRNNKYIHNISRSGKEGHKKPQGLYEMDLLNPRI